MFCVGGFGSANSKNLAHSAVCVLAIWRRNENTNGIKNSCGFHLFHCILYVLVRFGGLKNSYFLCIVLDLASLGGGIRARMN